jgi:N-acetylmuramoyl-L-alanine amidase
VLDPTHSLDLTQVLDLTHLLDPTQVLDLTHLLDLTQVLDLTYSLDPTQALDPIQAIALLTTPAQILMAGMTAPVQAMPDSPRPTPATALTVVYPPEDHRTTSDRIFIIGSAPARGTVWINDEPVQRSAAGHFAPTILLAVGANTVTVRYRVGTTEQTLTRTIERVAAAAGGDPQPDPVVALDPRPVQAIATVTVPEGVARSGPSTDHARLTPLPQGTQAAVVQRVGDWLALDYGGWIRDQEVTLTAGTARVLGTVSDVSRRSLPTATELVIPVSIPVPVTITEQDNALELVLHNAIAKTQRATITPDAAIAGVYWDTPDATTIRYRIQLSGRSWGYQWRYENLDPTDPESTPALVLRVRRPPPPVNPRGDRPLQGITILLDPGHGGDELGARGPTGYPEKSVNLDVSLQLRDALRARGATVVMTRTEDRAVPIPERLQAIATTEPTLALSIHYNALPDGGDALHTQGVGMFWYHPQALDLATFLHETLTTRLDRPAHGVIWGNLALARPTAAPSVLLELGFMIHPEEFEWIVDPASQAQLVEAIATGLVDWLAIQSR